MVELGSGAQREIDDIALTRYACYLIAQNGDASKSEIAFAQTYFAVQTRKQEVIEQRLLEKNLKGQQLISKEHVDNNTAVREILQKRGVQPEKLPAAEDVKKVQRRLESDEKKVSKTTKKLNK